MSGILISYKILSILLTLIIVGTGLFLAIYSSIHIDDFGRPKVLYPVGKIVLVINVIMYIAPGQNLYQVCKTQNYKLILVSNVF